VQRPGFDEQTYGDQDAGDSQTLSEREFHCLLPFPKLHFVEFGRVVHLIVASGGKARHLVRLDVGHDLWVGGVGCSLLEAASAKMAMQALAIVEWLI